MFLNRIVRQVPESVVLNASFTQYSIDESLTYPYLKTYPFKLWETKTQILISNFLFIIRGFSKYFGSKLVCFNHSWTSRLDSYILIAIKKLRFFSLTANDLQDLLTKYSTWYSMNYALRNLSCFWVLLLFVFDQKVVRYSLLHSIQCICIEHRSLENTLIHDTRFKKLVW